MGVDRDSRKMTFRPMPVLTVLSLFSLVILYMLGSWQYQRYSEKIDRPVADEISETISSLEINLDLNHPGNIQQVYGFADSEPIWRRYVPGSLVSSGEPVLVMVEATGGAAPVKAAISSLPETVRFGIVEKQGERQLSESVGSELLCNPLQNTIGKYGPGTGMGRSRGGVSRPVF